MFGAPDCALCEEIVTMRPQPAVEHVGHGGLHAGEGAGEVHGDDAGPTTSGVMSSDRL